MKVKVMFDRVMVETQKEKNETDSGIVLVKNENQNLSKGKVVSVGKGEMQNGSFCPMEFEIMDKVVFEKHCAVFVHIDGKEYAILKQIDILGKIEEE